MPRLGSKQLGSSQLGEDSTWTVDLTMEGGVGENLTVVAQYTDVLGDGLDDRDVTFDSQRGAFVTDWQTAQEWIDASAFAVRLNSTVETGPIQVKVERDDTGDGSPDATSDWVEMRASEEPAAFPEIENGEAAYRLLIRYVRPDDYLRGVDTGLIR